MKNKKILIPLVAGVLFSTSLGGYFIYSQSNQEKAQTEQKDKKKSTTKDNKLAKKDNGLSKSEQKQLDQIQVEENPHSAINKLLNNDEKNILSQIRSNDTPQLLAKADQKEQDKNQPILVANKENNNVIATPLPKPEENPILPTKPEKPGTGNGNENGGGEVEPPVIVNTPPKLETQSLSFHVGEAFNEEIVRQSVSAYDEEDGDLTEFVKIDLSSVNTQREGTYPIVYSVSDSNKAKVSVTNYVTVINVAPEIKNAKNKVVHVNEQFTLETALKGVSVYDYEEGDLTSNLKVDSAQLSAIQEALLRKIEGDFTLTYFVSDSYGKTDRKAVTISIINEAPVFNGLNAITLHLGQDFTVDNALKGITAHDYEDGDITSKIEVNQDELKVIQEALQNDTEGNFELTYKVKDSLGKETIGKRSVAVINDVPVINLPIQEITINVGDTFNALTGITAHDVEDGDLTSQIVVTGVVDTSKEGTTTISYDVTDSKGKKAETKYLTVHVIEKEDEGANVVE